MPANAPPAGIRSTLATCLAAALLSLSWNVTLAQGSPSPARAYPASLSWLSLAPVDLASPQGQELAKAANPVPNFQRVLANAPGTYAAWRAYAGAVRNKDSQFTLLEKELLAIVISAENRCDNCVISHSAVLRKMGADPLWIAQVQSNYRKAPLSERERLLADFATKITRTPWEMGPQDLDPLRKVGVNEQGLIELAHWTSFFNLNNRLLTALGIEPDRFNLDGPQERAAKP